MIYLFHIGTLMIIFTGFVQFFLKNNKHFYSAFSAFACILTIIPAINVFIKEEYISHSININPYGELIFNLDYLSSFFVIIICSIGFFGIFYSKQSLEGLKENNYHTELHKLLISIMLSSMLWVVSINNTLGFLFSWEVMSLSSFFLIIYQHNSKQVIKSALQYLVIMHISFVLIISGFMLTYIFNSHSFNILNTISFHNNDLMKNIVIALLILGFSIKAGFVPFHIWMPRTYPYAPAHISGIMSAIMAKIGIYGILRTLYTFGHPSLYIVYLLTGISLLSILTGITHAILQTDIKKIISYSSIENIGIIGLGISLNLLARYYNNTSVAFLCLTGSVFHILNHSIYKSLLFFCSGNVCSYFNSNDIEKMGALSKKLPYTSFLFIIASIGICALPPFNGFISEFLIYLGLFKSFSFLNLNLSLVSLISIIVLAFTGVASIFAFTRLISVVFLGNSRSESKKESNEYFPFNIIFLAIPIFLIGLFPKPVFEKISLISGMFFINYIHNSEYISLMQSISRTFFFFIIISLALFFIRKKFTNKTIYSETWSCGYKFINKKNEKIPLTSRFQYTGHSHSKSFFTLIFPFVRKNETKQIIDELHPTNANTINEKYYHREYIDYLDCLYTNIIKYLNQKILKLNISPSGHIQNYLLYGVIFLVIVLAVTIIFSGVLQ